MSESKHTPGDWRPGRPDMFNMANDDRSPRLGKTIYVDDPRGGFHSARGTKLPLVVGEAFGDTPEEVMANANVQAAGPDMYAVLCRYQFVGREGRTRTCPACRGREDEGHAPDCDWAAAIAKAERGEEG